jgi:acyl-CoA synthetase (AMP-forming)/AMP-acid ligase II
MLPKNTKLFIMYGATEAGGRISYLDPKLVKEKINSIGKPIEGVNINIIDKNGKTLKNGQIGELVVSGPSIMKGYWNDKNSTSKVVSKLGYHTGDFGYKDINGFYYLKGRNDKLVKINGYRINLQEIEDSLYLTGMITEAKVLTIENLVNEMKIVALICNRHKTFSIKTFMKKCIDILPKYKMPQIIKAVNKIPKNYNGKIDEKKCIELINGTRK